ncbi:MAG: glutathione peroxidase [Cyclobacteriaceae bacterium]
MRYKPVIVAGIIIMGIFALLSEKLFSSSEEKVSGSLYDFTITSLNGTPIDFDRYKGKNVLIVNTASECGYTPQYETLQQLHETYGDRVVVLGFPANNFLWQEPGSNAEIATFCKENYGVTFQMFEKISVKGRNQHPLYKWLTAKSEKKPTWNFCKYLVNTHGEVTGFYGPKVSPLDEVILKQITR